MNRKWIRYGIILALAIVIFFVRKFAKSSTEDQPATNDPAAKVNRNHGFDRRIAFIEYTEHARCRMECRHISENEVQEIMVRGDINYKKSDVNAKPCPTYALEGITEDNQRVRIVFGQCDQKTKVITCIDVDTNWECDCKSNSQYDATEPSSKTNN